MYYTFLSQLDGPLLPISQTRCGLVYEPGPSPPFQTNRAESVQPVFQIK